MSTKHLDMILDCTKDATAAPEILCWLLGGPLSLNQIIARRLEAQGGLDHDPNDGPSPHVTRYIAVRSVLYDLGRLADFVDYGEGRFRLAESYREAVETLAEFIHEGSNIRRRPLGLD